MIERSCHFSTCRRYRYELRIIWDRSLKPQMFIGLNPSTADETNDDPTIRRCIDFSKRWGAGGLVMTNLFAYRATNPLVMLHFPGDPIGEENTLGHLRAIADGCLERPIAAWGNNALKWKKGRRVEEVRKGWPLDCLRATKEGQPEHPLYLPSRLRPVPWNHDLPERPLPEREVSTTAGVQEELFGGDA